MMSFLFCPEVCVSEGQRLNHWHTYCIRTDTAGFCCLSLCLCATVATFTLPLWCGAPAPILHFRLCVWMSQRLRGEKFHSSTDTPLEIVSELQYWKTEPVRKEQCCTRTHSKQVKTLLIASHIQKKNFKKDGKHTSYFSSYAKIELFV